MQRRLGSLRKAAKDRISLATRRNTLRSEARQTLRNLRDDLALEDADRLRIRKADAVRIRELGVEYERIATRMESVREKIPELTLQLDDVANRLAALPVRRPIDALKSALAVSEEALPIAKQLRSLRAEKQTLVQACERGQTKLGLSTVPLGSLGSVQAPVGETVQLFEDRFDALERRRSLAEEEIRKAEAEFLETERRLREARLEREVPSEEDLKAARELRDRGWRLVARQLSGDEVPEDERRAFLQTFPGKDRLVDAFEASIQQADAVSDRLRREADRVASYARLKADRLTLQERIERSRKELSAVLSEKAAAEDEWGGLWKPVSVAARSPREMRQWLQDFSVLAEKASETLKRMSLCETMVEEVDNAFAALGRGLQSVAEPPAEVGESLPALVKRAREVVDKEEDLARRHDELSRERNRLENELASAKARLQAIEAELQRWRKDWELALRPLGLEAGTPPAAAAAVMEELKGLFDRLREAEVLQQRVDGIDRDAEAFAAEVKKTAEAVAADLSVRPAEEAAIELQRRLTAARGAQSRRQGLQKQIEQTHAKQRKAESSLAEIASLLKVMCADAGCTHSDELPEAERRSALRARLEDQLRQHNERLQQLSGGLSIDEFAAEAMSVDPDGIAGDIERLDEEITRLTSERSVLDQTIGRETSELGRMDGGSRAAGIAEDIQLILGGLETDVVNYARLKIAARVLGLAVERFREKSQGPILRKASGFFSRITCGSFDGIRADHDPDGNPVLVGVRSGGKETVPVGGMSDGTADQLYLALRLAGLDHYLDGNEPMPFIVDDILVKFDNDRATAALQTLAELSQKTQVIFFTHHRHLVDLAVKSVAGAMLFEHSLDASRPAVL